MSCPGSFIRVALPGSGDALICCIAQFAHSWYLLVTIYVSCRFRNQSAPLNWKQCSAYTTEQQLCWGCTVTLTHSVSKLQQRQQGVAAILHRFLHEGLHRFNGSLNLPVALGLPRTARDMLEVPSPARTL